jgi:hypothetical protein
MVQQVWSNITRRQYKQAWEGEPLEPVGYTLEWQPRDIACGQCGKSLGKYVAYRAVYADAPQLRGERGLVERTSRHYQANAATAQRQAGNRGPKSTPRFWLEGEIAWRAAKTSACFRCPSCGRAYRRNLASLGEGLFTHNQATIFVLE